MDALLNHPYTDPTQIAEFNAVADLIGCKPLYIEQPKAEQDIDHVVEPSEPPPNVEASFDVSDILKNVFSMVANAFPQWKLKAEEVEMLSDAWGGAIDYWFPELNEHLTPTSNALITTGVIIAPRLLKTDQHSQPEQENAMGDIQTFGELKNAD